MGIFPRSSFDEKYRSCKQRLGLAPDASDLDVHKTLVTALIASIESMVNLVAPITA